MEIWTDSEQANRHGWMEGSKISRLAEENGWIER